MQILLVILLFIAILLFIVNLYFEFRNRQRISKIEEKLNETIINTVETFKRWTNIKSNMDDFYNTVDKGDDKKSNEKKD